MKTCCRQIVVACFCAAMGTGCSRGEPQGARTEPGPQKDYRQMLEHVRTRQEADHSLVQIRDAIQQSQVRFGRVPTNLYELVRFGLLDEIPAPPDGSTYYYEPMFGNVRLGPLPPSAQPPTPTP